MNEKFCITEKEKIRISIKLFLIKLIKSLLYLPNKIINNIYNINLLIYNYINKIKNLYLYNNQIDDIIIKSFLDKIKYNDSSIIIYSNYIAASLINLFEEKYKLIFNLTDIIYFKRIIREILKRSEYSNKNNYSNKIKSIKLEKMQI